MSGGLKCETFREYSLGDQKKIQGGGGAGLSELFDLVFDLIKISVSNENGSSPRAEWAAKIFSIKSHFDSDPPAPRS